MTDAQTPTQATRAGNWRDVLTGSGSFRGVPFYVSGRQNQRGGRRIAKREFPLRENGGADDLGKSLREYSFKAVLLGTDYLSARDALITALDTPGAGELVHPNYGTISVQIATWECTENTRNGGSADFDITFYPPLDTTAPVSTADAAAATNAAADSATDSLLGDFGDNWDISSLSMNDIDALINNATSYVNEITSNIQQVFGVLDAAGDIMSSATALAGSISSLIYQPAAMIHQFNNLISSAGGLADTASSSFSTYKTMADNLSLSDDIPPVIDSVDSEGNPSPVLVMPPTSPEGIVALQQFRSTIGQLIVCRQAASATIMLTESIRYTQQEQQTATAVTQLTATEAAQAKFTMAASLNLHFYEELAASHGYDVTITQLFPHNCRRRCTARLVPRGVRFTTIVTVNTYIESRRFTCLDNCMTPLMIYESGELECLLDKYGPAHETFIYFYNGGE